MSTPIGKAVFIYWIDERQRLSVCNRLGLPTYCTLNGKTVVTELSRKLYDELTRLADDNVLRLTLKP